MSIYDYLQDVGVPSKRCFDLGQFDSLTAAAPEHDLLLKSQGPSWSAGVIQVTYSASQSLVVVSTYAPGAGWTRRGGPWHVTFAPGDRFGARALADGRVQAFRNGVLLGEASAAAWPFFANGGRIGVVLSGAVRTRITRFGGGTLPAESPARGVAALRSHAIDSLELGPMNGRPWVSYSIPNPVTHDASFALALPRDARVGLAIYDLQGREIWREPERAVAAGRAMLHWSGADARGIPVPTGVYLARVTIDGVRFPRRLTMLR